MIAPCPRHRLFPCLRSLSVGAAVLATTLLSCVLPKNTPKTQRPVAESIQSSDAELANAKVTVVADFESPEQMNMLSSSSSVTRPRRSTAIARPGTGSASLELPFDSANVAFWASADATADSRLPRDWTPFQMLVMSVYAPRDTTALRIIIRGGGTSRAFVQDRIVLHKGWNTVRLDCEEVGRSVDLTDVRQIEWSVGSLREPLTLHVDDIALVDNTEAVFGSRDGATTSLYVIHAGRRLHVGAVGRFELVFRRGLIVGWYDLPTDPDRHENLVNETLGPFPVPLQPDHAGALSFNLMDSWSVIGETPTIKQSLLEISEARAIVRGEWRWSGGDAGDATALTWQYTIYPTGRVFVRLTCPTQSATWRADEIGVVVLTNRGAGFAEAQTGHAERAALGLLARPASDASDLLAVVHQAGGGRFVPIRAANQVDAGVMLVGSLIAQPAQQWAFLLQLWPADIDSMLPAEPIARDYAQPSSLNIDWGDAVLTTDGDLDNDGYNESEGLYEAAPKDGILRFTFNDEQKLRFEPTLKLLDTAGKDVWAYADGRIVRDVARDAAGNAIVRLADAVDQKVLVEVHCHDRAATETPATTRNP